MAPFDERDCAVTWMIRRATVEAQEVGAKVGLCGPAPSKRAQIAAFLMERGIGPIFVSPDSFIPVKQQVAKAEGAR